MSLKSILHKIKEAIFPTKKDRKSYGVSRQYSSPSKPVSPSKPTSNKPAQCPPQTPAIPRPTMAPTTPKPVKPKVANGSKFAYKGLDYEVIDVVAKTAMVSINEFAKGVVTIPRSVMCNGEKYAVIEIGELAFSGSGIASAAIPASVLAIGESAFEGCRTLKSVTIPNSVARIGAYAFAGCSSLSSVVIPSSATVIAPYTFEKCASLVAVSIPGSIAKISEGAFAGCAALASVSIGKGVAEIDNGAFKGCNSLARIVLQSDIPPAISNVSFEGLYATVEVTVNANSIGKYRKSPWGRFKRLVAIEPQAQPSNQPKSKSLKAGEQFEYKCLNFEMLNDVANAVKVVGGAPGQGTITIPDTAVCNGHKYSVAKIGKYAFRLCRGLGSVVIPNSVTTIEDGAFTLCLDLNSVRIPNSVTEIGEWAFYGCGCLSRMAIPSSVQKIGEFAFCGCVGLNAAIFSGAVTEIGKGAFASCALARITCLSDTPPMIAEDTFDGQYAATVVTVPAKSLDLYRNTNWGKFKQIVPDVVPARSPKRSKPTPKSKPKYQPLNYVLLDAEAKTLAVARNESAQGDVIIPDTILYNGEQYAITAIAEGAFANCAGLTSITIGKSVAEIGPNAFDGCGRLARIVSLSVIPPMFLESSFSGLFYTFDVIVPAQSLDRYRITLWAKFEYLRGE